MASVRTLGKGRTWVLLTFIVLASALSLATAHPSMQGLPVAHAQIGGLQVSAGGPYSGQVGQPIFFSAQVSLGGQFVTTPVQFLWNFGDGGTGFGQTTFHAYAAPGVYPVTVAAQTSTGLSAFATTTAQIGGSAQGLLVSAGGPYSGQAGIPITFTAQIAAGLLQPIAGTVQFQWSFGDGSTGFGQSVSHTYTTPGTYTVTVTAATAAGVFGSATTTATIGGSSSSATTEQVALYAACNNVAVTWPNGTAISVVAGAVSPADALVAIWKFDNTAQRFFAYSSVPGAPNDLTAVNRGDPVFICITSPGTFTRPVI